jgi:cytochrome c oxidase subunit 2
MFAEITWGPSQASTTATNVDRLLLYLVAVCGAVGAGVAVCLITFAVRYRRRRATTSPPPSMHGNVLIEIVWSVTPLFFFLSFFVWGAGVYLDAFHAPDDATVVYGVGKQWMWKFQHPGGQREMNSLHVPIGRPVKLLLTSEDVIHSFFVPDFRVHMDVLPDRYTSVWFNATRPGEYHLFCSQYCGTNHSSMIGTVVVMRPDEFQRWLDRKAEGSRALEGQKTFLKYRCASCHTGDGTGRAPDLGGLFGRTVHLRDGGSVVADEKYVRESILDPGAKVVAGYENIMPTFAGQISQEEIFEIIVWLKTLKPGEMPRRVEESSPPAGTPPINPREEKP